MGAVAWETWIAPNDSDPATQHIARTEELYACGAPRDPRMPIVVIQNGFDLVDCDECAHLWRTEGGW